MPPTTLPAESPASVWARRRFCHDVDPAQLIQTYYDLGHASLLPKIRASLTFCRLAYRFNGERLVPAHAIGSTVSWTGHYFPLPDDVAAILTTPAQLAELMDEVRRWAAVSARPWPPVDDTHPNQLAAESRRAILDPRD